MNRIVSIVMLVMALGACATAGRDFSRAPSERFVIGQTNKDQVLQAMGSPHRVDNVSFNGEIVEAASYVYVAMGTGTPLETGVTPVRSAQFYFQKDRLVGQTFNSSFKDDHTRFDDTLVTRVIKGTTRRSEVIALLGKPAGTGVAPIAKAPAREVLIYSYITNRGANRITSRNARIGLDANDVVDYVEVQNRNPD